MTLSMTAFARAKEDFDGGSFCWEIRSVNHRYLDVSFRLPESLRFIETELRQRIRRQVNRGKIECQLRFDRANAHHAFEINDRLIQTIVETAEAISRNYQVANDLSASDILKWPGVTEQAMADDTVLQARALHAFDVALRQLNEARVVEGQALNQYIVQRLDLLEAEIKKAQTLTAEVAAHARDKLLNRIAALSSDLSESRIEQEVVLMVTKLDVSEEIDRLHAHVREIRSILNKEAAVGRRLDFYMQELNREANTLSSKSDNAALTSVALEMKVLAEQMREQIQNIE